MQTTGRANITALICVCSILLAACSHSQPADTAGGLTEPDPAAVDYSSEIHRWELISRSHEEPAERARAHFQLALLYLSYHNPNRDYGRAREHLDIFVSLYPEASDTFAARDWLAALMEMDRLSTELAAQKSAVQQLNRRLEETLLTQSDLQKANRELARSRETYERSNSILTTKNRQLKQKIEKINNLDQMVEAKRKSFQ